jgi:hypothetical protein
MKINIGDTFTTRVSGVTGTVKEIHDKGTRAVLLLDVNGQDRYTTV